MRVPGLNQSKDMLVRLSGDSKVSAGVVVHDYLSVLAGEKNKPLKTLMTECASVRELSQG